LRPQIHTGGAVAIRYSLVKMLRAELSHARAAWIADAKVPEVQAERERSSFLVYRDDAGQVVDFHALRHTFISNLARGGVHPKLAQALARHSDINLTMNRNTHTTQGEQSDALAALPNLSAPQRQGEIATGTAGRELPIGGCVHVADRVARKGAVWGNSVQADAVEPAKGELTAGNKKARENPGQRENPEGEKQVRLLGLEPKTYGLKVRCSTN